MLFRYQFSSHVLAGLLLFVCIGPVAVAQEVDTSNLSLVFEEDFEDGVEHWNPLSPSLWKVTQEGTNRVYELIAESEAPQTGNTEYVPPHRSPFYISILDDVIVGSFVLQVEAKYTGAIYYHQDLSFFFGWQDPAHFYYAHLCATAGDNANTILIVNEADRKGIAQKQSESTDWIEGQYHTVQIVRDVESGVIEVYFDDLTTPVITAEDRTFLTGKIGLGSFDDAGRFDNLRIWSGEKSSVKYWMLYE